jgi:spoIIIJ-associated protein
MEKQIQIIKSLIETILEKLTVTGEVEILFSDEYPQFIIRTKEAGILIGENGQNLMAFNCLLKKIAENEFKKRELEKISFLLDVNDYQTKKIEELKNLAKMNAQRARYFKKEIIMDPMNAYERRIIHTALTEYPDLETKSIGEDPDRRVVIKPFLC